MENWAPITIQGFEGLYEVSDLGRVRSAITGKIRKVQLAPSMRYPSIVLCSKGKTKTVSLHILVARAFVSNPLNLPEVNHKNCIKTDCQASNLEWSTHPDNQQHAAKNRRYRRKLNTLQVKEICALHQGGASLREIAVQFEIHWTTVRQVTSRQTWRYL